MSNVVEELPEQKTRNRSDMRSILTIDDDRSVHHMIKKSLESLDAEMISAYSAEEGLAKIDEHKPDAILLDVMLPDMSGLEAFGMIREKDSRLPVIVVTGSGSSDTAIQAMKLGAFDYVNKPIEVAACRSLSATRWSRVAFRTCPSECKACSSPTKKAMLSSAVVGPWKKSSKRSAALHLRMSPCLVRGESGTGKELVARAIYQYSTRADGPFLAVNCAALSETLLESELFGHEKGAFTGAHSRRIGKFEQCSGGTIFLDEVGDMSPLVQGKVLRLLAGAEVRTRRRQRDDSNRCADHLCDESRSRANGRGRHVPERSVLPSQWLHHHAAAAARSRRRCCAAAGALSRAAEPPARQASRRELHRRHCIGCWSTIGQAISANCKAFYGRRCCSVRAKC